MDSDTTLLVAVSLVVIGGMFCLITLFVGVRFYVLGQEMRQTYRRELIKLKKEYKVKFDELEQIKSNFIFVMQLIYKAHSNKFKRDK